MPKILVAPGSGDIHWVMLKMESIIEKRFGGEAPEVWVWSENRTTERSEDYVRRVPFVKWGGYFRAEKHVAAGLQTFVHGKPWFHEHWNGFDMFVAFNAPLGWGTDIGKLLPQYSLNWGYPIQLELNDLAYASEICLCTGDFVMVSFFGHSFYAGWLKHFGVDKIKELLKRLADRYTVVLTGREWDKPFMSKIAVDGCFDLVGKTSMGDLLGLMTRARAFVGFAAGNGMLAQHLRCKTFMLWDPKQWDPHFATNWVDPQRRESGVYHPLSIRGECINYITENLDEESVHSQRG